MSLYEIRRQNEK